MIIPFLEKLIIDEYGKNLSSLIFEGYKTKRLTTFRLNTLKDNYLDALKELKAYNFKYYKVPLYDNAYVLEDSEGVNNLNCYKEGLIYFQSLSSMLPPLFLDPLENEVILDMAAAPGSKTSQICALTHNLAEVFCCEVNKIRAERLKYNINKLGCKNVTVNVIDASKLDDFFSFDKILLDAPCSGSGTYLENDKNSQKISYELVKNSQSLQLKLIKKAVKVLKKGHYFVYSTCSILKEENEDVVNSILKDPQIELVKLDNIYDLPLLPSALDGVIKVRPTNLYEGFFVAKFRKK